MRIDTTNQGPCNECGNGRATHRGLCTTCYERRRRNGDPLPPSHREAVMERLADVLEDVTWLAETGAGLTEAARRLDTTPEALKRLLQRHNRSDLLDSLRVHDEVPDAYLHGSPTTTIPFTARGPVRGTWKVA